MWAIGGTALIRWQLVVGQYPTGAAPVHNKPRLHQRPRQHPLWSGPFHLVVVVTRAELIIQLLKIAIGVGFGAYFLWWSLAVLQRLPVH